MKGIHVILAGLSLNIILLSFNRLTPLTAGYLQPLEFLRWLDFNAMVPIPLMSVLLYYLLFRIVSKDHPFQKTRMYTALTLFLITGIYLFAAGSGDHEVTNYLNTRFCDQGNLHSPLCNIISFNDDEFSHYLYYAGFILMNLTLMAVENRMPNKNKATNKNLVLITINSLLIALGIFANLAFEDTGIDIAVFSSVALISTYFLLFAKRNFRTLPVTFYFTAAYVVGVMSTVIYKFIQNT